MNQMSAATKQVAEGNFSIKLKPRHTEEHLDYLDVMFLDFNTMVEELSSTEMLRQHRTKRVQKGAECDKIRR